MSIPIKKKEPASYPITIRVSPQLLKWLEGSAKQSNMYRAPFITKLLIAYHKESGGIPINIASPIEQKES